MALSKRRIDAIRELAKRGAPGEKENAIAMLAKLGLDIDKPKDSLKDQFKNAFGMNTTTMFTVVVTLPSDWLFLSMICAEMCKKYVLPQMERYGSQTKLCFVATHAEAREIGIVYNTHRHAFNAATVNSFDSYIQKITKK